ncbi:uncharacterized protein N7473_009917 [Penicillium subrubescens]|uniref:Uncharacterized protein n=1 Tax=Penicillium subrubescens TaxID=1316194 RepID=A0A1Q5U204_9EURO|nr:uncharacterized protein N7473_009917 [Penicillium subrubescens]KAJ5883031.1 hypothetical protein N7473_009917 [Penicillium subrubescens]OKP06509.1 hypothetical protein PENSUB_6499 [Penicillium subrubescens]
MPSPSKQHTKSPKTGKAFRRVRTAIVGDLYQGNQFPQWIRRNGGEFHDKVTDQITHLIASEQAYEDNVDEVQAAKALGKIKIVSRDWLTASLHANPIRPVPERPFLLENLVKPTKKNGEGRNGTDSKGKVDSGIMARTRVKDPFIPKGTINQPKKAIFRDPQTGGAWDAVLTRAGKTARLREKYRVAIFETSSQPPTYSTYAKYSRVGTSRVQELTLPKSDIATAVDAFKQFFKAEAGKDWEDRNDASLPTPKTDNEGNVIPAHQGWYFYKSQENIFTSFIMRAGPPGASTDGSLSVNRRIEPDESEADVARPEGIVLPKVLAMSEEDSGNNADVESEGINIDAS